MRNFIIIFKFKKNIFIGNADDIYYTFSTSQPYVTPRNLFNKITRCIVRAFLSLTNSSTPRHRRNRVRLCLTYLRIIWIFHTISHSTASSNKRRIVRCVLQGEQKTDRSSLLPSSRLFSHLPHDDFSRLQGLRKAFEYFVLIKEEVQFLR